jgi:hypothetical protein
MAILNHCQIEELRNPRGKQKGLSGCPLGHLKTKLFEFHLIHDWHDFLRRVRDSMHTWGHSLFFTDNDLAEVPEKMFYFIIIEINKLKLKLTPHLIPLLEKSWRGYPDKK